MTSGMPLKRDDTRIKFWRWVFAAAVLFTVGARIDLWVSEFFFVNGGFPAAEWVAVVALRWLICAASVLLGLFGIGAFIASSNGMKPFDIPTHIWGGVCYLFALGPFLIISLLLKRFSGRARPFEVEAFGGDRLFSPALMLSDECDRNCSFASAEAAAAIALAISMWVLARYARTENLKNVVRNNAVAIALIGPFLILIAGQNFVSDIVFAGLIVIGLGLWLFRQANPTYVRAFVAKGPDHSPIPLRLPGAGYIYDYAVVIPALNEADNIRSLAERIDAAMAGRKFELIVVDDGSTDDTGARLADGPSHWRLLRHPHPAGQSAAVHTGVKVARAPIIVTLDGDGQNPPEEIPKLLDVWERRSDDARLGLVAGQRAKRIDTPAKRYASKFANGIRSRALKDGTRDTGCGLKAFRRDVFLSLPFFNHMHRYLPALTNRAGYTVDHVDVDHAAREAGSSKYTNLQRGLVGAVDLLGVMWLIRRKKTASPSELDPNRDHPS